MFFFFSFFSFGQPDYPDLMVKDYEEMEELLSHKIALSREASQKEGGAGSGALNELKQGLVVLFMHPQQGTNDALLALLKSEIISYTAFWRVVLDVVRDSLEIVQGSSYSVLQRASHLYVLENVLTYIKNTNEEEFNQVLSHIAKARIKIPREVINHRFINASLGRVPSPSSLAKNMLKKRLKEKKQREKKEKALEEIKKREKEALEEKKKAERKKPTTSSEIKEK